MIRSTSGKSRGSGDVIIHTVTRIIEMSCYTILILLHPTFLPYDPFAVLNSWRKKMLGCQNFIVAITGRFELPSDYMLFAEKTAPLSISLSTHSNILGCHGEVSESRYPIYTSITNKMQRYTIVFITIYALHISGGSYAHHQELKTIHSFRYLPRFFCFLPLSWVENSLTIAVMQTLYNSIYYYKCSTCFRRFLRPSSGAKNCVNSIGYLSNFFCFLSLSFQLTHDSGKKQKKLEKYTILCIQFWAPDDGRRNRLKHVQHL